MQIQNIGVVGAGTMGNGIAQAFAQAGFPVTIVEIDEAQLQRGLANIRKNLNKAAEKGQLAAGDVEAVMARISSSTRLEDLAKADLVVEAA
ncbi:MAG: 3-hydroxyacyl-CoA dehydrogenase NAD-binding domain-containing protein [Chloroflexi bacterium]|nr:3-hydroxyacyl-CoA dehydrogenase NAD-binding domain-containing protein [Chloroflexota bacterium]